MVTFTINIPQIFAYIPYMDLMGTGILCIRFVPRSAQVLVPPRLSQPILAENQRLTLLQRAFELHRRLVEALVGTHRCSGWNHESSWISGGFMGFYKFLSGVLLFLKDLKDEPM